MAVVHMRVIHDFTQGIGSREADGGGLAKLVHCSLYFVTLFRAYKVLVDSPAFLHGQKEDF